MRTLPEKSVQLCVTSPPYFGLRDYGHDGQIGLEPTPDEFVGKLVEVFREVRRVLRDDGTLWMNLGDSYAAQRGGTHQPAETLAGGKGGKTEDGERVNRDQFDGYNPTRNATAIGLKHKDLIGIPWRVAFALQSDGWYLRQDIIWHKPNPMPESVRDRCTKAHEYVFLLSKRERYFYDAEAVSEAVACVRGPGNKKPLKGVAEDGNKHSTRAGLHKAAERWREEGPPESRNRRSVWTVTTKPYSGAHFATMPPDLVEPCILAGCPDQCCPVCGAGYERIVEQKKGDTEASDRPKRTAGMASKTSTLSLSGNGSKEWAERGGKRITLGWQPACDCAASGTIPGTVLDPFTGSGTTLAVAAELGRSGIGCELNSEYIVLAERRIRESRQKNALFEGVPA